MQVAQQLSLFPEIIDSADLVAIDNPRNTFYHIRIEYYDGVFTVVKESGSNGRIFDKRKWLVEDLEKAKKTFERRVKSKTNPRRKSPRKYIRVSF